MQMISEVMTREVVFVSPDQSLQQVAQMMNDMHVGVLPVCDGDRLVGMITDQDISVLSSFAGKAADESRVDEAMSADVQWCFEDQSLDEVMQQLADSPFRSVPVVTHDEAHRLVGIVALGDLESGADATKKSGAGQAAEKVSAASQNVQSNQAGAEKQAAGAGASADKGGGKTVGAPGAAFAPGVPAEKDAIGGLPSDEITGAGRRGRVGFAGDPGGLSPADIEESQRAAAAGAEGGEESARTAAKEGSTDAKRDAGTAGTSGAKP
jgi:CBS domain-containing protein